MRDPAAAGLRREQRVNRAVGTSEMDGQVCGVTDKSRGSERINGADGDASGFRSNLNLSEIPEG
jgi:hypothetical protein